MCPAGGEWHVWDQFLKYWANTGLGSAFPLNQFQLGLVSAPWMPVSIETTCKTSCKRSSKQVDDGRRAVKSPSNCLLGLHAFYTWSYSIADSRILLFLYNESLKARIIITYIHVNSLMLYFRRFPLHLWCLLSAYWEPSPTYLLLKEHCWSALYTWYWSYQKEVLRTARWVQSRSFSNVSYVHRFLASNFSIFFLRSL